MRARATVSPLHCATRFASGSRVEGHRAQVGVERLQGREGRAEAAGVVVAYRALRGRLRGGEGHRHGLPFGARYFATRGAT